MSQHFKQLDAILRQVKLSTEQQIQALQTEQFAYFKLLPGGAVDWTPQQIAVLEGTIRELTKAISVASAAAKS